MKASTSVLTHFVSTQALVFTLAVIALLAPARIASAQVPTMTVTVTRSDVPLPLTVVRGTLVIFQGPISQQMTMTTFVLRNDYGEFARGDFLDSWKLAWNTATEHDPSEQIAVLWRRPGTPLTRLTRYNVKFVDSAPFTLKAENTGGKLTVAISPTGTMTAQRYTVSLDSSPTDIEIDNGGKKVIDISHFRPGPHTVGASAVMTDGSATAIPPVPFEVSAPPAKPAHKPAPPKRKPAKPRRH